MIYFAIVTNRVSLRCGKSTFSYNHVVYESDKKQISCGKIT